MKCGHLEIVIGPMWSSKSKYLASKVAKYSDLGMKCAIINHSIDDRDDCEDTNDDGFFTQHGSSSFILSSSITKIKTDCIRSVKIDKFDLIAVDECQFFDDSLIECVKDWVNKQHKIVLCAGLDGDFNGKKFGYLLDLIPQADKVKKLRAQCNVCLEELKITGFEGIGAIKANAPFSALISKNLSSKKRDNSQIIVGGSEKYISMCRYHHQKHLGILRDGDLCKT